MKRTLIKQGENFALVIEKSLLDEVGIDQNTELEVIVLNDSLIIKPKKKSAARTKKKMLKTEKNAKKIMDKYESVFKKLAQS